MGFISFARMSVIRGSPRDALPMLWRHSARDHADGPGDAMPGMGRIGAKDLPPRLPRIVRSVRLASRAYSPKGTYSGRPHSRMCGSRRGEDDFLRERSGKVLTALALRGLQQIQ